MLMLLLRVLLMLLCCSGSTHAPAADLGGRGHRKHRHCPAPLVGVLSLLRHVVAPKLLLLLLVCCCCRCCWSWLSIGPCLCLCTVLQPLGSFLDAPEGTGAALHFSTSMRRYVSPKNIEELEGVILGLILDGANKHAHESPSKPKAAMPARSGTAACPCYCSSPCPCQSP